MNRKRKASRVRDLFFKKITDKKTDKGIKLLFQKPEVLPDTLGKEPDKNVKKWGYSYFNHQN